MERLREIGLGFMFQLLIFGWLYACSETEEPLEQVRLKPGKENVAEKGILLVTDDISSLGSGEKTGQPTFGKWRIHLPHSEPFSPGLATKTLHIPWLTTPLSETGISME